MAGKISQRFRDTLLERCDIIEIISPYVTLRKIGRNHQGLCPFHDEKTPSFSVQESKQFYYCFGCGAHGNAIDFLMNHLNVSFIEAVSELATRYHIPLPKEGEQHKNIANYDKYYVFLEKVVAYYRKQLLDHKTAKKAQAYLHSRLITADMIGMFELGYAPTGWDNLLDAIADQSLLEKMGLIIKKRSGNQYYDRFRYRIIFPIRDLRGRVIGFGGRALGDEPPKYLNSPQTVLFHKGYELYGLHQVGRKVDRIFVVEGYMDVIALAQNEICNSVATLGTAITAQHLEKLFSKTGQIIFCFDGDDAGKRAAERALERSFPFLQGERQVYFMFLPEGQDPDSFIRANGRDEFLSPTWRLPLSTYLLENLAEDLNLKTSQDQATFIERSRPFLAKLPAGDLRMLLIRDIAKQVYLERSDIEERLEVSSKRRVNRIIARSSQQTNLMGQLIGLILYQPSSALSILPQIQKISGEPGADFLFELLDFIKRDPDIKLAHIFEHYRGSKYEKRLGELAVASRYYDELDVQVELKDVVSKLIKKAKSPINDLKSIQKISDFDLSLWEEYKKNRFN